eukprot:2253958-Karenia_brevis.AAC.1
MATRLVGMLPIARRLKILYARIFGITKASYGWVARRPTGAETKMVSGVVWRSVGGSRMGSPYLRKVVEGALVELDAVVGVRSLKLLWRRLKRRKNQEYCHWHTKAGTLVGGARKWMKTLGWEVMAEYKWRHAALKIELDLKAVQDEESMKKVAHELREAWRWKAWGQAQKAKRRDAEVLQQPYDSKRVEIMRKMTVHDTVYRHVVTGSYRSPAVMEVAGLGQQTNRCIWPGCQCRGLQATQRHVMWECQKRTDSPEEPKDDLQRRLGWPVGENEEYDEKVLRHMARVAIKTWEQRYGGDKRKTASWKQKYNEERERNRGEDEVDEEEDKIFE